MMEPRFSLGSLGRLGWGRRAKTLETPILISTSFQRKSYGICENTRGGSLGRLAYLGSALAQKRTAPCPGPLAKSPVRFTDPVLLRSAGVRVSRGTFLNAESRP